MHTAGTGFVPAEQQAISSTKPRLIDQRNPAATTPGNPRRTWNTDILVGAPQGRATKPSDGYDGEFLWRSAESTPIDASASAIVEVAFFAAVETAGLTPLERIIREPYVEAEHPSRRAYVLARR